MCFCSQAAVRWRSQHLIHIFYTNCPYFKLLYQFSVIIGINWSQRSRLSLPRVCWHFRRHVLLVVSRWLSDCDVTVVIGWSVRSGNTTLLVEHFQKSFLFVSTYNGCPFHILPEVWNIPLLKLSLTSCQRIMTTACMHWGILELSNLVAEATSPEITFFCFEKFNQLKNNWGKYLPMPLFLLWNCNHLWWDMQ